MKPIKNNVLELRLVPHRTIEIIQGELKELTRDNYHKLKRQLVKHGITAPVVVWDDSGVLKCLDGTQRIRTYEALENEGYSVPLIPAVVIQAENEAAAREILLSLVSQYGTVTIQGLLEFATSINIDLPKLQSDFNIPNINFRKVSDEYTKDHTDKKKASKKCPECGCEF